MALSIKASTALVILALLTGPAQGRDPLPPTIVEIRNRSGLPIVCIAQLAHWFSTELGEAMPNEALRTELQSDPESGAVFVLNAAGDRLPVEAAWCGFASKAWETRSSLPLERRRGEHASDISVSCDTDGDRLRCR